MKKVEDLPLGIKEFVHGEVYYTTSPGRYFFRYVDGSNGTKKYYDSHISLNGDTDTFTYDKSGSSSNPFTIEHCRVATFEETLWYVACFNAGKIVPIESVVKPQIKVSYTTTDGEIKTVVIEGPIENARKLEKFKHVNYHITL